MKKLWCTFLSVLILSTFMIPPGAAEAPPVPEPVAPSGGIHAPVPLQHQPSGGKVIMILVDRTSIDDWVEMNAPNLHSLAAKYAVGLMNDKTGGRDTPEDTCLTIGSGVPLRAPGTAASAFPADEELQAGTAWEVYKQRTGNVPPPNSIIQTSIAKIYRLNENSPYTLGPGTLGKMLREAGIKTAVLGNSDGILGLRRQAVFIAMDDAGIVDTGAIGGNTLLTDPDFPGGTRTNYQFLLKKFISLPPSVRFVVIDLGDFSRIEDARNNLFESVISDLREKSVERMDKFLGQILQHVDLNRDLLIIASPTPGGNTVKGENLLTPVLVAGNGVHKGLIYSPTTKRPGIIRNTDLLPTILQFLNINIPPGITGQAIQIMPGEYTLSSLARLQKQLALTFHWRRPILQNYVLIQLLLLGVSLLFIFWKKPLALNILKPVLLAVMSVPVALLILPLFPRPTPAALLTELLALVMILILLSMGAGRFGSFAPFMFISGLTSMLILIDLLMGAPLQKTSLLGYDPIMGARFYGLGNEYMGVLLGSTLIAATSLLTQFNRYKRPLLIIIFFYFLFAVYIIGAPNLGTNVGGTISSVGAFLVTALLLTGVKIDRKVISLVCLGVVTAVIVFILYDMSRPVAQQSHIGRTASLILSGGFSEITNIISRKIAMNIKLIRYTIWSRIFLASLGCLAILFYRPSGIMQLIQKKYPLLYKGFAGVIIGSILALIFNDSGVVAAATAMIFGVHPMIYLILQEIS